MMTVVWRRNDRAIAIGFDVATIDMATIVSGDAIKTLIEPFSKSALSPRKLNESAERVSANCLKEETEEEVSRPQKAGSFKASHEGNIQKNAQ